MASMFDQFVSRHLRARGFASTRMTSARGARDSTSQTPSSLAQIGIDLIRRGAATQAQGIRQQAAAQSEQLSFQAAQARQTGEIDARQALAQAQAAEFNRETALREAGIVREETATTLRQQDRASRLRLGAVRAAAGGAGIRGTGSAADILADVSRQNVLEARNIRVAGETEAGRFERTAGLEAQRASFARESAENIRANASLASRRLLLGATRAEEAGQIAAQSALLSGRREAAFASADVLREERATSRAQARQGQQAAATALASRRLRSASAQPTARPTSGSRFTMSSGLSAGGLTGVTAVNSRLRST